MNIKIVSAILINACIFGCARGVVRENETKNIVQHTTQEETNDLLENIKLQNNQMPKVYSAQFVIDGVNAQKKQYKALGSILCNLNDGLIKIVFTDSVFKTPLGMAIKNGQKIKVFMPMENTVFEDDARFINVKNYININIDFNILHDVICWRIPLIDNSKISQLQKQKDQNSKGETYVILENERFYETISIKNGIANKIMIVNKNNNEKMEFYFENLQKKENVLYFDTIRYISPIKGERINARFSDVKLNIRFKEKDFSLPISGKTKIVKVN